jgi:hypothetical protein
MGLIKPSKTIKPFKIANFSQNFDSGILETTTDLTSLITSSDEWLILLNRENYSINTNAVCTTKYIKGVLSNSKQEQGYYPTINILQPLKITGTWIFENVYITGNAIQLQTGSKLILRNCFLFFSANVSFNCIDATNGSLIIENTRIYIYPIGGAIIKVVFGNDVKILNSSIDRFSFASATGTLNAENSDFGVWESGTTLNNYNINLKNCTFGGFYHGGNINLNAVNCNLGKTLGYVGTRGINGKAVNCVFNSLIISNASSILNLINCFFNKIEDDTWSGCLTTNGGNPTIRFYNCTLINTISNQYILQCNNSNSTIIFANCTFKSTLGRFQKSGTGTNSIRTIGCVGNKDITTDSGFNVGEVNDTNFVFDGNF